MLLLLLWQNLQLQLLVMEYMYIWFQRSLHYSTSPFCSKYNHWLIHWWVFRERLFQFILCLKMWDWHYLTFVIKSKSLLIWHYIWDTGQITCTKKYLCLIFSQNYLYFPISICPVPFPGNKYPFSLICWVTAIYVWNFD